MILDGAAPFLLLLALRLALLQFGAVALLADCRAPAHGLPDVLLWLPAQRQPPHPTSTATRLAPSPRASRSTIAT
jgi:hypothetical protein